MTKTPLPQSGGSFVRDAKSGLKKVAGTKAPATKTKPKAKPAEKEA